MAVGKTNLRGESFPFLQVVGNERTLGAEDITVVLQGEVGGSPLVAWAFGATVPTDATAGYNVGCIFIDTGAGAGTTMYINEGSTTSCDFNAVT